MTFLVSPCENLSFSQERLIHNRFQTKDGDVRWLWVKGSKSVEEGRKEGREMKWQMKVRDRWKAEIDQRGWGVLIAASLSRNWVFQLEPGYRPSGDPLCQASMSVWLKSLVSILPVLCQVPGFGVYTESSCHANWICQMEGWGIEKGGVSLRYAKEELISPSNAAWQARFHPTPRFDSVDSLTVQKWFTQRENSRNDFHRPCLLCTCPSCAESCYINVQASLHAKTCVRTYI